MKIKFIIILFFQFIFFSSILSSDEVEIVSDNIKVVKRWNPILKKKVDTEILDTCSVEFFQYNNHSNCIGSFAVS